MAIPDSSLTDESTKVDKTRKVSQLARAAAIFGVHTIFVYRDGQNDSDRSLLVTMLRYMETPQFLRRHLYPKMNELKFAGVLHPLAIPSHKTSADETSIKDGDVREGLAITLKGRQFVDVGVKRLIRISGEGSDGRVTVQFRSGHPNYEPVKISRDNAGMYWGYVVRERHAILPLLKRWQGSVIVTTRFGKSATPVRAARHLRPNSNTLVVFGSPQRDVQHIAGGRLGARDMSKLNFFPDQNTRTVRLEEAVLGVLSILNMYSVIHQ